MSLDAQIETLRNQIAELERKKQEVLTKEETVVKEFNEAAKNPAHVEYYMPSYMDFMRMIDLNEDYHNMSFAEFISWNMEQINNLSLEDREWLNGLCRRIRVDKIRQMDLENCVEWDSCGFYYDPRGHLCIMHPR